MVLFIKSFYSVLPVVPPLLWLWNSDTQPYRWKFHNIIYHLKGQFTTGGMSLLWFVIQLIIYKPCSLIVYHVWQSEILNGLIPHNASFNVHLHSKEIGNNKMKLPPPFSVSNEMFMSISLLISSHIKALISASQWSWNWANWHACLRCLFKLISDKVILSEQLPL